MSAYTVRDRELKKSLDLVIFSITFGMVFFTIVGAPVGSVVFTGFMRKLGAGDFVYSVVMALPVLGAVSQIFGSYAMERTGKRKLAFLASGFVHRLLWIPVAVVPLFFGADHHQALIWLVTIMITVSSVANSINGVAFNSWMGALVPTDIVGRFFGLRTLVSTVSGAVAALAVGIIVDHMDNLVGFCVAFILAAVFGVVDIATFIFIKHPPLEPPEQKPSLLTILTEPFKNGNYLKFTLYVTFFLFAVNVAGPFFNIYMLEDLKMNYFIINLSCQVMSNVTTILTVRYWGVLADRFGNKPVTLVGGVIIVIVPLVWVFTSPSNVSMVFVANILGGVGWAGYNLAVFNQVVWLAPERNRSAYTACYTLVTSVIGTAAAYVCGGWYLQVARPFFTRLHIPFVMGATFNAFTLLFIISAVLRLIALVVFYPTFEEKGAKPATVMLKDMSHSFFAMIGAKRQ